ncbi:hypothetical protein BD413DRAFT_61517 [Trametes elegans]|nr:hypothetical protein BD413DRAFT_61517 [Trametes elegans]
MISRGYCLRVQATTGVLDNKITSAGDLHQRVWSVNGIATGRALVIVTFAWGLEIPGRYLYGGVPSHVINLLHHFVPATPAQLLVTLVSAVRYLCSHTFRRLTERTTTDMAQNQTPAQRQAMTEILMEWINAEMEQVSRGGLIRDYLPRDNERTSVEEMRTRPEEYRPYGLQCFGSAQSDLFAGASDISSSQQSVAPGSSKEVGVSCTLNSCSDGPEAFRAEY